jgi:hypothetical protein
VTSTPVDKHPIVTAPTPLARCRSAPRSWRRAEPRCACYGPGSSATSPGDDWRCRRKQNYFYLWDAGFGPAFIKVCTYCPWPMKIWINAHERAKQQARKLGLGFTELSSGFADCDDLALLQRICDSLQPGAISVFFQRWLSRLPLPLTAGDQRAGYWRELSMAQVEVSRAIVFTQPRYARC